MIMGNDHTDSPSKANQHQETVVRAFFESLSIGLEGILGSPEAMEATLSHIVKRRDLAMIIVCQSFRDVESKKKFQQDELNEFRDLQNEFFRIWISLSKP